MQIDRERDFWRLLSDEKKIVIMNSLLLAVILILLVVCLLRLLPFLQDFSHVYKLGSKLPGPPALPLLGNALQIPQNFADWTPFFTRHAANHLKNGESIMRLWISFSLKVFPLNGKAAKDIIDSSEEITKADDYDIIQPWLGVGLLISTGEKWRTRRRMLTPTFHFAMLDGYVESMDRESRLMTELIQKYADRKEEFDVFPYVKRCALDIICETAMGYQLNSQTNTKHPYALSVAEMSKIATAYIMRPWLWFAPIWYLSGYGSRYNSLLKVLTDFTKGVIKEKMDTFDESETEGRKAFLDMLISMKDRNSLSDEDIREEVDTFMFEGHDTTSSGMAWTIWCLATHPEIQEKAYQEIHEIFGDSDREITINDIKQMNYLDRVLKESLRLNPPVPFVGRKLKNDLTMDGHLLPKGGLVYISPLIIQRNGLVFEDPGKFNPDRFLPENSKNRHAYDYIPFSAGPRNCIGQKFAIYEEKILLAWVLRKFRITSSKKFKDNRQCSQMILQPDLGVPIQMESR